jgi:hypothetical protein
MMMFRTTTNIIPKQLMQLGLGLGLVVSWGVASSPALASETLSVWYGPFQRSLSIADLRQYAETGTISPDLAGLFRFVKPKTRTEIRKVLNYKVPLDVVTVNRLLDSPPGKQLLEKVSPAFIRKDDAGIVALRGGLILSAASKDGLTALSFLESYPNSEVSLNLPQFMKVMQSTKDLPSLLMGR